MLRAWLALQRARRAYKRAERAQTRAANQDAVYGLWEALDGVRYDAGERLVAAEVTYLLARA